MKKKIVLLILMMSIFTCLFAITVSASIPEWTDTDNSLDAKMSQTSQYGIVNDTESRIMFSDNKTYPAWYFIKTENVDDFLWLGDDTDYNKIGLDFNNFYEVSGTKYTKADVVKLEVPVGIQGIGQKALSYGNGFTSLKYVKLPEGLTVIAKYAFKSNSENTGALIQIDMPSTLLSIEEQAFNYCSTLTTIHIPNSVEEIGKRAFYRCYNLTTIIGGANVKVVKDSAFSRCPITNVGNIFDNVETVETYAFYYIKATDISMPKVKTIGKQAFYEPSNLITVKIGPNATVGNQAFYKANNLTTLTIGAGTTFYSDETFYFAKNISTIYYTGSNVSDISGYKYMDAEKITANVNHCVAFYDGNHVEGETKELDFKSYTEGFSELSPCQRNCGAKATVNKYLPIIQDSGYSSKENDTALCITYIVNKDSIEVFQKYNPTITLKLNLVAAAIDDGESADILNVNENGEIVSSKDNFVSAPMDESYASFDFILRGFNQSYLNYNILLCAYIFDGTDVLYVISDTARDVPVTITLQEIINNQVKPNN